MDVTPFLGNADRLLELDEVREGFATSLLVVGCVCLWIWSRATCLHSSVREWRSLILILRMG